MTSVPLYNRVEIMDAYDSLPQQAREFCAISGYDPLAFSNDLSYSSLEDVIKQATKLIFLTKHTTVRKLYGTKHPDLSQIAQGNFYDSTI